METSIKEELKKYHVGYLDIVDEKSLKAISKLFTNDVLIEPHNEIEYVYLGIYYQYKLKNFEQAVKCYLEAIERYQNKIAMVKLGNYYHKSQNYQAMEKYYLMAIDLNCDKAMYRLGYYYKQSQDPKWKQYYLMAIASGHRRAMLELGEYYRTIEINYSEMKKYLLMAIESDNKSAMYALAVYYRDIKQNQKKMVRYFEMNGDYFAIMALANYYKHIGNYTDMKKYYILVYNKNNDNVTPLLNLAYYHRDTTQNYEKMKKYFSLAANKNNKVALYMLANHYHYIERNYPKAVEYYVMAIEQGHSLAITELAEYYANIEHNGQKSLEYLTMNTTNHIKEIGKLYKKFPNLLINILGENKQLKEETKEQKITIAQQEAKIQRLKDKLAYSPNGEGYFEAKRHFEKNV